MFPSALYSAVGVAQFSSNSVGTLTLSKKELLFDPGFRVNRAVASGGNIVLAGVVKDPGTPNRARMVAISATSSPVVVNVATAAGKGASAATAIASTQSGAVGAGPIDGTQCGSKVALFRFDAPFTSLDLLPVSWSSTASPKSLVRAKNGDWLLAGLTGKTTSTPSVASYWMGRVAMKQDSAYFASQTAFNSIGSPQSIAAGSGEFVAVGGAVRTGVNRVVIVGAAGKTFFGTRGWAASVDSKRLAVACW